MQPPPSPDRLVPEQLEPARRPAPALLMSLGFHVVLLVTLGLLMTRSRRGTGAAADRPIGIAMVHRMPDRDRYVDAAQVDQTPSEDATAESSSAPSSNAAPSDLVPPLDLAGILEAVKTAPVPSSGSGLAGQTDLNGQDFGAAAGSADNAVSDQASTVVFGVSGTGSKFVYVFDRSDSMNGFSGKPLQAAKSELTRSLGTLSDRQQFQVIFYNDQPSPLRLDGSVLQLMHADRPSVITAQQFIRSIVAYGGTAHQRALDMALRLGPDVIFFLTDARIPRLSSAQLAKIQRQSQRVGATIHAIEFGTDPAEPHDSFLKDLAAMNGGEYKYVNVQDL